MKTRTQRFMEKVVKQPNGCWIWQGQRNVYGYGCFRGDNLQRTVAHRWSAEHLAKLDITNKVVCHRCDTPACVNPEHLFVGTQQDNLQDCRSKQRHARLPVKTPLGTFESQASAARAHDISPCQIGRRLRLQPDQYQRTFDPS
jgi:hypothetical protein